MEEKDSNEEDKKNNDQLNLNKKSLDSERDELDKRDSESNTKEKKDENEENKAEEAKKKDEKKTEEKNKEDKKKEKKKEEKKEEKKKEKVPIVPYKVDSSYQKKLLTALEKKNKIRPQFLLELDIDDIREKITKLDQKEEEKLKLKEKENSKFEKIQKETKACFDKYKSSALKGETLLQDPFALFSGAEKIYIDQYYKLSDLFVICPLYYNYRISLEYCIYDDGSLKKYEAYHLFNTKEITPPCSHNLCANQFREIDINIFNFVVDSERETQPFISIKKPCRCAISCFCACCSRPTFIVESLIESIGKIVEIRTICDPILKIYDINDDEIFSITTSCSNCGYCLRDECCNSRKCATCEFAIYTKSQKRPSGKIIKDHRSGRKTKPDYDQIEVTYPPEISCQEKILIMCGALALEYLYFQNLSNSKRCNGNPRFLNTFN